MKKLYGSLAVALILFGSAGLAQTPQASILEVDVENYVQYFEDTSDVTKFATDQNVTTTVLPKNFFAGLVMADIVAVNGQPAKGTLIRYARNVSLATAPTPGQAIADDVRNAVAGGAFEILKSDGTPVGTIVSYGFSGGSAPPGAPLEQASTNFAITGGTGAFLGARGQYGQVTTSQTVAARQASVIEDPANRRRNGGGRARFVLQVFPMFQPQIAMANGDPAVFHADFSPVSAAKPAKAGEVLIAKAAGLGSTVPGVDLGQPFPSTALQPVNAPVDVTWNGQAAEVLNAIGWPGLADTYRVDFRVPSGAAAGSAALQLKAAWIASAEVRIPVQ